MEIETTLDSVSQDKSNPVPVSPASSTLTIIDELSDRERRKRNVIVYYLLESAASIKNESDAFAHMCSSIIACTYTISKSVRLGKKVPNNTDPCCYAWRTNRIKLCYSLTPTSYAIMSLIRMFL